MQLVEFIQLNCDNLQVRLDWRSHIRTLLDVNTGKILADERAPRKHDLFLYVPPFGR